MLGFGTPLPERNAQGRVWVNLTPTTTALPCPVIYIPPHSDLKGGVQLENKFPAVGELRHELRNAGIDILKNDVVTTRVKEGLGYRDGNRVALTDQEAIEVYLLGWEYVSMMMIRPAMYSPALQFGLRQLSRSVEVPEDDKAVRFFRDLWGERSVAWMREILIAVAVALKANAGCL